MREYNDSLDVDKPSSEVRVTPRQTNPTQVSSGADEAPNADIDNGANTGRLRYSYYWCRLVGENRRYRHAIAQSVRPSRRRTDANGPNSATGALIQYPRKAAGRWLQETKRD